MNAPDNQLPHNLDAEAAVLGILLFDNAALELVAETLRPEHFYEPFHRAIFGAIVDASASGRLADPTLLSATLKGHQAWADYGVAYLLTLMEKSPPTFALRDYARDVHDLALRRDLWRLGDSLKINASDFDQPAAQHLSGAEAALFSLAEHGEQAKTIASFAEAASGAIAMAEAAFRRDGKLTGISTGLIDLDQKLGGLHPSDLLVLAGRPSMGKTALATNIAFHVARSYRWTPDPDRPGSA